MTSEDQQQSSYIITDLLSRQLAEWQTLKTQLLEQYNQAPTRELYTDIMCCEAILIQLDDFDCYKSIAVS